MGFQLSPKTGTYEIVQIVQGSSIQSIVIKAVDYTAAASDYTILINASSAPVTISLPLAPTQGQMFSIKSIDSTNACTL
ncbi:hypothetical protein KAR91_85825, partial [Candidatus Pacearchaeota archaeon]|nr:hypothetical protein [Candidatus Pacearchaeota archaeon]